MKARVVCVCVCSASWNSYADILVFSATGSMLKFSLRLRQDFLFNPFKPHAANPSVRDRTSAEHVPQCSVKEALDPPTLNPKP